MTVIKCMYVCMSHLFATSWSLLFHIDYYKFFKRIKNGYKIRGVNRIGAIYQCILVDILRKQVNIFLAQIKALEKDSFRSNLIHIFSLRKEDFLRCTKSALNPNSKGRRITESVKCLRAMGDFCLNKTEPESGYLVILSIKVGKIWNGLSKIFVCNKIWTNIVFGFYPEC